MKIALTAEQRNIARAALEPMDHLFRTRNFRQAVTESLESLRAGETPDPAVLELALTASYESRTTYCNIPTAAIVETGKPVRDYLREQLAMAQPPNPPLTVFR